MKVMPEEHPVEPPVKYLTVFGVRTPSGGLYIPYPGALVTGSYEAALNTVKPNKHLGFKVVRMLAEVTEEVS